VNLERLDHVSINVADRTRSIAWYRDVLGLEQQNDPTADDEPVFMGEPGQQIGLFQAQVVSPDRAEESTGVRHFCFTVDDIYAWRERLGDAGRHEDHGNSLSVYVRDPDGNVVELTTYV
jgi:catechol 2,3-dioxygenase-like lactoylglutathione lyase family enzyme